MPSLNKYCKCCGTAQWLGDTAPASPAEPCADCKGLRSQLEKATQALKDTIKASKSGAGVAGVAGAEGDRALNDATVECSRLALENKELRAKLLESEKGRESEKSRADDTQLKLTATQKRLKELEEELEAAKSQISLLQTKLQQAELRASEAQKRADELLLERNQVKAAASAQMELEKKRAAAQLAEMAADIRGEFQSKMEKLNAAMSDMQAQWDDDRKENGDLLAAQRDKVSEIQGGIEEKLAYWAYWKHHKASPHERMDSDVVTYDISY